MNDDPQKLSPEQLEQLVHRELRSLPPRPAPTGFEARFQARLAARQAQQVPAPAALEQIIHRELRALPPRRAPRSLETRVLAAIEARNAVPWWHKSWSYWPTPVRALFAVAAAVFAGTAVAGCYALLAGVDVAALSAHASERLSLFVKLYHAGVWTFNFGAGLFQRIPSLWLYGGLVFVSLMYVALFGLGAAAYRTLYRTH